MGMSASQARLLSLTARLSDLELRAQEISNSKIRLADESQHASDNYTKALDKQLMSVYNSDSNAYEQAKVSNLVSYTSTLNTNSTNSKYRYITNMAGELIISNSDYAKINNAVTYPDEVAYLQAMGVSSTSVSTSTTTTVDGVYYEASEASFQYYDKIWNSVKTDDCDLITNDKANDTEWLQNNISAGNIYMYEFDSTGGTLGTGSFENASWTSGDSTMQEETDSTQTARAEAEYETTMANINSKDERFDLELKSIDTEHTAVQTEIDSVKKVIDKNIERSFKIFDA